MCGAAGVALAGPHDNADAVVAVHMTGKKNNIGCLATQANPTQFTLAVLPQDYITNDTNGLGGTVGNNNSYVWLMVANADEPAGVAGLSCGVDWAQIDGPPGSMLVSWQRCSELEFPSGGWPGPGGGNRITWAAQTNCQRQQPSAGKVTACAGFFLVSSYVDFDYYGNPLPPRPIPHAYLQITKNQNVPTPELAVADCGAIETQLEATAAGWAGWNSSSPGVVGLTDTAVNDGQCPGVNCVVPGCNPYLGPCEGPVPVRQTTWGMIKNLGGGE
jgi:hypothetical protein